jgi:ABC-type oligopeptide transport system substrate-binding subunit
MLVLAALMLAGGCSKGNFSQSASQGKENVFRYSIVQRPSTLDPGKVQDGNTIDLLQQVFEGLTTWSEDNKPVPNLCEKWDISPDGTVYTFTLKKGVKFHSGREVKASDFKYSIERACDPKLQSTVAGGYLDDIVGVKEMVAGKADNVPGIQVVDDYTLEIKIDKPRPYFLGKLTYPCSFVVDKDIAKMGQEITTVDMMKSGTGPFIPESYQNEQVFTLVANKNYHGGAPAIEKIERPVLADSATRIAKYRAGELDLIQLERQDIAAIEGDEKFKSHLKFYDRPAIWYVGFNPKLVPALADVRVRRAIAMAINRKRIVEDIMGNFNKLATGILPPGVDGARENVLPYDYDPVKAKALLKEAGMDGKMPAMDMYYRSEQADYRLVVESVQADLKQNLGITINAKPLQTAAYLDRYNKKNLPTYHMRWGADYLDPQNFLSIFFNSTGNENKFNYNNPEVDRLTNLADVESDHEKRMKLYAQAEDIVLADVAWVPIFYQRDAELVSPRIQGMRESLFGHLPHTTVKLSN